MPGPIYLQGTEAIAFATELKADMVLIDEQEGRQLASRTGLKVTGVLGILLRAKRAGALTAVKPEIFFAAYRTFFEELGVELITPGSTGSSFETWKSENSALQSGAKSALSLSMSALP